jgi:hypothetical protein
LLKKYVKNGGISKAYLGSKFFDPSLIEPIKKKIISCIDIKYIDSPLNSLPGHLETKIINERVSRSQPRIPKHGIPHKLEK